jgi:ribosomal-protein-alanine N-acetyltransferase
MELRIQEVRTDRLLLGPFVHEDAAFIISLLNSPGWLKYIGDRHVHTPDDAVAYLNNGPLKSYRENGFGLLRVSLRESGKPIGMCGLLKREELDSPDLGFAFLPDFEGYGFASEAAAAVIDQVRTVLRLPRIAAIVQNDNLRSITLLKKNGFAFEKQVVLGPKQEVLDFYGLSLGLSIK